MTETLGADDEWDLPRLSAYETFVRCAEDFGTAYEYMKAAGTLRRDGLPGTEGNLTGEGTRYPNGVTAKAMQGRALLFAASKLNNRYGESDWRAAAEVCAEAITLAGEWGYSMETIKNWSKNFTVGPRTNEQLWAMAHLGKSNGKNGRTCWPSRRTTTAREPEPVPRRITSTSSRPNGAIRSKPRTTAGPPSPPGITTTRIPMRTAIPGSI